MIVRHPPASKWGKDLAPCGEKEEKKICQSTKVTTFCGRCAVPCTPMIKYVTHSNEDLILSLQPSSESQLQRTSRKEVCVTLASSSWEGRDHLRPKYCTSPPSNANAASWRCLAVAWTVVFLTLLHTPTTWSLSSASGGYVSSPHLHDATGRNSSSSSSVLAALPPLLHRQQTSLQAFGKEAEARTEAGMPVSEGAAGGARSLAATGSPDARATFLPTVTSTVAAPPAPTATEASTLTAAAVPTATPAASITAAAAAATPLASVTPSVPAATPAMLALLTRIAAAPARAASAALPSAAEGTVGRGAEGAEVSRTGIDEAVYAATSKPTDQAGALRVGAPLEPAGRAGTAAARSHQIAAERASPEDGRGGDARGAGEEATAAGEGNEAAAAATAMEPEVSSAGRSRGTEGVRFSGGRVNGYFWRSAGRASFLSTTAGSAGLSAALDKVVDKLEEAGATGNAARASADEPTREAEEREKAHAAAAAAPDAAGSAFHATEAGGEAAGGRTATWRAAVAAHKKALEEEARAARNAASKPSAAEEEAAARRVAASRIEAAARSEASARREAATRRKEEGTGGVSESMTDSCAAVLQPMVRRGLSEAAVEKIKRMLAVERFVEKVSELRKIAARRCLAGEKDACETPENPVWQTAGLSKPPEAPTIKRFRLPAELCPAPSAGSGSTLQDRREVERLDGSSAASTVYSAEQVGRSSDGETKIYTDVAEAQGSDGSAAMAAAASFLAGAEEGTDEANRRSYVTMEAMKDNNIRSTFLRAETTGAKEENTGERPDSDAAAGCTGVRAADRSSVETPGEINIDFGKPPPATYRSKDSSTSESSERESRRREGGKSTKRSVSRTSGGSSDGESSTQDSSSHSTVRGVLNNSRSSSVGDTQMGRWTGQTSPVWGRTPYPKEHEGATAEEGEQWREAILNKPAVLVKRRNFYKSRRAPLQLRMGPDDSPLTLLQARSRGIFSTVQSLFGNGMDISNPQNFDGGNQGSFFNFMYPADTDYPWACVCDENQWKRWENKEIEAVPCRNQVDTSAQGITAACNPLNHHLNAASPSRAHANAIILGLLSAATILVSSAA